MQTFITPLYVQLPTFKGRADVIKTGENYLKKEACIMTDISGLCG